EIRPTEISTEYLVPSQKKGTELFYIVNTEFCICICFIGLSGAPCKYQGAVAAKYNIGSLNFFPSLSPNDRACFVYIACGIMADSSFYASLHAHKNNNHEESNTNRILVTNINTNQIVTDADANMDANVDTNVNVNTNVNASLNIDLNANADVNADVNVDVNASVNINPNANANVNANEYNHVNVDADVNIATDSGAKICIQVESVKRRKTESSVKKSGDKENRDNDSHIIPARKVRAI
ncbi:25454_t:CDS:2, partial [Racocetra persica]